MIKLDENLPFALAGYLRECQYDTETVVDEGLSGADDSQVLKAAITEQRILLTFDQDFADIREYPLSLHCGIVVFRLRDQRWKTLESVAKKLVDSGMLDNWQGGLMIVDEKRMRFRKPHSV